MMTLSIIALIVATFALLVTADNVRRFNNKIEDLNIWIEEIFRVHFPPKEEEIEEKCSFSEPETPENRTHWYFGVPVSDMQNEKIKVFKDKHFAHGSYELIISSSGIGPIMYIRCKKCGEKEDITDVDTW